MSARWRLAAPHYLNVPGTEWQYQEVDRTSGKQKRTQFAVPLLLDPDNPGDWNIVRGKDDGEIVVTNAADPANPRDIVFVGKPTPDMVPLNDEAKSISASLAAEWKHPIESLPGTYADEMLKDLGAQMDKAREKASAPAQVEGMGELLAAMASMMKQNQEIMSRMVSVEAPTQSKAAAASGRRP